MTTKKSKKTKKEKELLKIPASVNKITTMADNTLKLTIYTTRELTSNDEAKIMKFRNTEGVMVFSVQDINQEDLTDIPEYTKEFDNQKSPSERLRNVMWVYYTQNHEWKNDAEHRKAFKLWRETQMDKIRDRYKDKLD